MNNEPRLACNDLAQRRSYIRGMIIKSTRCRFNGTSSWSQTRVYRHLSPRMHPRVRSSTTDRVKPRPFLFSCGLTPCRFLPFAQLSLSLSLTIFRWNLHRQGSKQHEVNITKDDMIKLGGIFFWTSKNIGRLNFFAYKGTGCSQVSWETSDWAAARDLIPASIGDKNWSNWAPQTKKKIEMPFLLISDVLMQRKRKKSEGLGQIAPNSNTPPWVSILYSN